MAYTQKLLGPLFFALAITLLVGAPAQPAAACGGYGAVDPDDVAIRQAALSVARSRRWSRSMQLAATILERSDGRARVRVSDVAPGGSWSTDVALHRAESGWVVSPPTSAAVARR